MANKNIKFTKGSNDLYGVYTYTQNGWNIKKFADHTFFAIFNTQSVININIVTDSLFYGTLANFATLPSDLTLNNFIAGSGDGSITGGTWLARVYTDGANPPTFSAFFLRKESRTNANVNLSVLVYGTW